MRHIRSILYALVLAPLVWMLCVAGFGRAAAERGAQLGTAVNSVGAALIVLLAGAAYAILLLPRLSPAGPIFAGLMFVVVTFWSLADAASFAGLWPSSLVKPGFDVTLPARGPALLLAVPLLGTAFGYRRWRRHELPAPSPYPSLVAPGPVPPPSKPPATLVAPAADPSPQRSAEPTQTFGVTRSVPPRPPMPVPQRDVTPVLRGPQPPVAADATRVLPPPRTGDQVAAGPPVRGDDARTTYGKPAPTTYGRPAAGGGTPTTYGTTMPTPAADAPTTAIGRDGDPTTVLRPPTVTEPTTTVVRPPTTAEPTTTILRPTAHGEGPTTVIGVPVGEEPTTALSPPPTDENATAALTPGEDATAALTEPDEPTAALVETADDEATAALAEADEDATARLATDESTAAGAADETATPLPEPDDEPTTALADTPAEEPTTRLDEPGPDDDPTTTMLQPDEHSGPRPEGRGPGEDRIPAPRTPAHDAGSDEPTEHVNAG